MSKELVLSSLCHLSACHWPHVVVSLKLVPVFTLPANELDPTVYLV